MRIWIWRWNQQCIYRSCMVVKSTQHSCQKSSRTRSYKLVSVEPSNSSSILVYNDVIHLKTITDLIRWPFNVPLDVTYTRHALYSEINLTLRYEYYKNKSPYVLVQPASNCSSIYYWRDLQMVYRSLQVTVINSPRNLNR